MYSNYKYYLGSNRILKGSMAILPPPPSFNVICRFIQQLFYFLTLLYNLLGKYHKLPPSNENFQQFDSCKKNPDRYIMLPHEWPDANVVFVMISTIYFGKSAARSATFSQKKANTSGEKCPSNFFTCMVLHFDEHRTYLIFLRFSDHHGGDPSHYGGRYKAWIILWRVSQNLWKLSGALRHRLLQQFYFYEKY